MKNRSKIRSQKGFTLLELSVVLTIIALVVGMGYYAMLGTMENAKRSQTENKMDAIEKALMAFRNLHNRLPCPSDVTGMVTDTTNYSVEAANPGSCTGGTPTANFVWANPNNGVNLANPSMQNVAEGGVPAHTLGLPDTFMFDGWGRRIMYAVDVYATANQYAFNEIKPWEFCGIEVDDASGTNRTGKTDLSGNGRTGAVYTLISYGANGHGGYIQGASRMNASSSNVSEQTNCHCNLSATTNLPANTVVFVQKDVSEDPAGMTGPNYFDDIVHFKERWQLQNTNDYVADLSYSEPQLAVGYTFNSAYTTPYVQLFTHRCDGFVPANIYYKNDPTHLAGHLPSGNNTTYVAFTQDNTHLFVYSDLGGVVTPSRNCQMYKINGHTVTDLNNGGATIVVPNCPAYNYLNPNKVSLSSNGYLAISYVSAGVNYVGLWKLAGDKFIRVNTIYNSITLQYSDALILNFIPKVVTFSKNATYLFLADSSTTPANGVIYHRVNDSTYTRLPLPTSLATDIGNYASQAISADFSSDESFVGISIPALLPTPSARGYKIDSQYNFAYYFAPASNNIATAIKFSPDSVYAGYILPVNGNTLGSTLGINKINDPATPALALSGYTITSYLNSLVAFAPDSNYLYASPLHNDYKGVPNSMLAIPHAGSTSFVGYVQSFSPYAAATLSTGIPSSIAPIH